MHCRLQLQPMQSRAKNAHRTVIPVNRLDLMSQDYLALWHFVAPAYGCFSTSLLGEREFSLNRPLVNYVKCLSTLDSQFYRIFFFLGGEGKIN